MLDPRQTGDDDVGRQAQEQPVSDHAGPGLQPAGQLFRLLDRPGDAVEDEIPLIGADGRGTWSHTERDLGLGQESPEILGLVARSEGHHLDRQRTPGAQHRRQLALVGHDHDPAAGLSDDLLPQEGTASTLDEIQDGIDLVRAIDGDVGRSGA